MIHVEYYILFLSPLRQNSNGNFRKDNNCGDNYSTFILDDGHLWDTITPKNTDPTNNKTTESIYSVL